MKKLLLLGVLLMGGFMAWGQSNYWQQRVKYKMDIRMDVDNHQYDGRQELVYTNNSQDTLTRVFYHLYFNAFQPESMMDVRSRTIKDPDHRVGDRIVGLSSAEIGYIKVQTLSCNGEQLRYEENGTILEVRLITPVLPGETVVFNMKWKAQVPLQIRRSGRDNKEGIDFSMTQWYPKMCEYDDDGWHSNPYVGREFYGVWGDYDVSITLPRVYTIGGTGVLVNGTEIGHGYSEVDGTDQSEELTWHFMADNVHDFAFAADDEYTHFIKESTNGTQLHFIYVKGENTVDWEPFSTIVVKALDYMNARYGVYSYPGYTIIQGGDGGMEYPNTTLITGQRGLRSLVGVTIHEFMHSWYQMMLGTNESLYSWMDEGFTSFAETEVIQYLNEQRLLQDSIVAFPWADTYAGYRRFITSDYAEPASTHSDHFNTNYAYGINSYYTGNIFLKQLEYIIGEAVMTKTIKQYYNKWKFKHPRPDDFLRVAERESDMVLDWYKEYWINTTKTIDYAVDTVFSSQGSTKIQLARLSKMPMPIDVVVELKSGKKYFYNIPLRIMRGSKPMQNNRQLLPDWPWTHPSYQFVIEEPLRNIKSIRIDPSQRMADIDRENNDWSRD